MTKKQIPNPDVSVFFKFLDRGFKLSVPADQEKYYREGYDRFNKLVEKHKSKERGYDEIEAIGLSAIDCMVALEKLLEQMEEMTASFQDRIASLDSAVKEALDD